ncbi:MAG: H-NS family nucleoid-associated regulatory protein [Janthinobacterium lividum]
MDSYKELLAQREKLERKIAEAKDREFAVVLEDIRQKMADFGITLADLGGGRTSKTAKPRARGRVAPKYRNPNTEETWSGRGKPPKWIAGVESRERFLINK